jgi:hypothetical protein
MDVKVDVILPGGTLRLLVSPGGHAVIRWPDPQPHDIAEVWDNAAALVARTCLRCGKVFAPRQLAAHPDDERASQRVADREGLELVLAPLTPRGSAFGIDEVKLDFLGCPGRPMGGSR